MRREDFPEPEFFLPPAAKAREFRRRVEGAARGRVAHLSHARCLDGAACDALVRMGAEDVATAFVEPHETSAALEILGGLDGAGRRLVVSDLSFQAGEGARVVAALERLRARGWRVEWRDHHARQWDDAPVERLAALADLTVDRDGRECGATLVQKALAPGDTFAAELARVVRDHDLWLRQDPRSVRLHAACAEAGSARFVARVLATRDLADGEIARWADAEERRRRELTAWALASARLVAGRRAVVGVAYGRAPTNDVLHALEERGAHASVLLKPDGSFSLRSRKDVPVCQRVASRHGGGGHPNASGGRLGLAAWELPAYWARRGDASRARALVEDVLRESDAHLAPAPDNAK